MLSGGCLRAWVYHCARICFENGAKVACDSSGRRTLTTIPHFVLITFMSSRYLSIKRASSIASIYGSALHRAGGDIFCHGLKWSSTSVTRHDPLRILFCGADEFSIYSLRALHALQKQSPQIVKSIDVVCRPDKRTGRRLKAIRQGIPHVSHQSNTPD